MLAGHKEFYWKITYWSVSDWDLEYISTIHVDDFRPLPPDAHQPVVESLERHHGSASGEALEDLPTAKMSPASTQCLTEVARRQSP